MWKFLIKWELTFSPLAIIIVYSQHYHRLTIGLRGYKLILSIGIFHRPNGIGRPHKFHWISPGEARNHGEHDHRASTQIRNLKSRIVYCHNIVIYLRQERLLVRDWDWMWRRTVPPYPSKIHSIQETTRCRTQENVHSNRGPQYTLY